MKEDILALAGGDTTDQQQYLTTTRRSEQLEPEKTLLIAILENAIHLYWEAGLELSFQQVTVLTWPATPWQKFRRLRC